MQTSSCREAHVDAPLITTAAFDPGGAGTLCSCGFRISNGSQGLCESWQREDVCPSLFIYRSFSACCWPKTALTWMCHCFCRPLTSDLFSCHPLQRQVAGEVQMQPQDRAVNQIAMMLAIMGLSLSYYSAKQMTEKVQVQPAPWRDARVTLIKTEDEPARRGNNVETLLSSSRTRQPGPLPSLSPWPEAPRLIGLSFLLHFLLSRPWWGGLFCVGGMARSGGLGRTGFTDWVGWLLKTCCFGPISLSIRYSKSTCLPSVLMLFWAIQSSTPENKTHTRTHIHIHTKLREARLEVRCTFEWSDGKPRIFFFF